MVVATRAGCLLDFLRFPRVCSSQVFSVATDIFHFLSSAFAACLVAYKSEGLQC